PESGSAARVCLCWRQLRLDQNRVPLQRYRWQEIWSLLAAYEWKQLFSSQGWSDEVASLSRLKTVVAHCALLQDRNVLHNLLRQSVDLGAAKVCLRRTARGDVPFG